MKTTYTKDEKLVLSAWFFNWLNIAFCLTISYCMMKPFPWTDPFVWNTTFAVLVKTGVLEDIWLVSQTFCELINTKSFSQFGEDSSSIFKRRNLYCRPLNELNCHSQTTSGWYRPYNGGFWILPTPFTVTLWPQAEIIKKNSIWTLKFYDVFFAFRNGKEKLFTLNMRLKHTRS